MERYITDIKQYKPKNNQEIVDQKAILQFIDRNDNVLDRSNLIAHMTSSAIVVNESMDKVLFIHHNIYQSWGWVGGHNDGDPDLLHVAIKEAKEETGLKTIHAYHDDIFMIDVIHVSSHIKRGQYVGDHLHLNVSYLLVADEADEIEYNPEENSGVRWFDISEVLTYVDEERMHKIYQKAFDEIAKLKQKRHI